MVAAGALLALASGCAGPRIVRSMSTTREGKFRLIYDRNAGFGSFEEGLIDCKTDAAGAISECQPVKMNFLEEG